MAYIEERVSSNGKISFRTQIRLKGFLPETASFQRRTDAKKWAQATEAAMREGRHFKTAEAKKYTLGDMIDRYLRDVLPTKSQLPFWPKVDHESADQRFVFRLGV